MVKSAIITGISGQDGAYLAARLLDHGYQVHGTIRSPDTALWRLKDLGISTHPNLKIIHHDFTNLDANLTLITRIAPQEFYNLAAVSTIGEANEFPFQTAQVNGFAVVAILEAIRQIGLGIRFFQASSAEIFGANRTNPQTENTRLAPSGSYALAKAYAHQMVELYRELHGVFACNGILYNHESPLRGEQFVSSKIVKGMVAVSRGEVQSVEVGNLNAQRDLGAAHDYVIAMHNMLQAKQAGSYLLCTGKLASVRDFIVLTAGNLAIDIEWVGEGLNETGIDRQTGDVVIQVNEKYYRPEPKNFATGIPEKARTELRWKASTDLNELCAEMVAACR